MKQVSLAGRDKKSQQKPGDKIQKSSPSVTWKGVNKVANDRLKGIYSSPSVTDVTGGHLGLS